MKRTQKKTIVMVAPRYYPDLGGVETHVVKVSEELATSGYGVIVVTVTDRNDVAEHEVRGGVEIVRLRVSSALDKFSVWQAVWRNRKMFQSAAVIQVHDVWWWMIPLLFMVGAKMGVTFHGWEGSWPVKWQAKLHRRIASYVSRARVHVGGWIQRVYGDVPDLVVYGAFLDEASAVRKSKSKTPSLVVVGRLEPENDVEVYCQFVEEVRKKIQLDVVWFGDGSLRDRCAKLGTVMGMVPDVGSQPAFQSAWCIGASSYLSIFDALGSGKLVVSLFSSELKKMYLESFPLRELLMMGSDAVAMAARFVALIDDKRALEEREKNLREVVNRSRSQLSWSAVAVEYVRLWQKKILKSL